MREMDPNPPIIPNVGNSVEEEMNKEIDLVGESVVKLSNLDEVKVFLFMETHKKRHILACPRNLTKCSMDIRPPHDPTVDNMVVILVPSLKRNSTTPRVLMENGHAHAQEFNMISPTNFIIWNIRGNNDDFRRNFREIMMQHKPCVVTLLETRMFSHDSFLNELGFSDMIKVPAVGQLGGMVVLWGQAKVTVHNFVRRNHEIHATMKYMQLLRYVPLDPYGYSHLFIPAIIY